MHVHTRHFPALQGSVPTYMCGMWQVDSRFSNDFPGHFLELLPESWECFEGYIWTTYYQICRYQQKKNYIHLGLNTGAEGIVVFGALFDFCMWSICVDKVCLHWLGVHSENH